MCCGWDALAFACFVFLLSVVECYNGLMGMQDCIICNRFTIFWVCASWVEPAIPGDTWVMVVMVVVVTIVTAGAGAGPGAGPGRGPQGVPRADRASLSAKWDDPLMKAWAWE